MADSIKTVTKTGDTFFTPSESEIRSLKVNFMPQQDLHGYDHPWPAGGNTNLLPPELYNNETSITENGVTLSVVNQKFHLQGLANANGGRNVLRTKTFNLKAGDYKVIGDAIVMDSSANTFNSTFTLNSDTDVYVGFNVSSGTNYNEDREIAIVLSTSASTWLPYSNICPITTSTGMTVYDDPKYNGEITWNQFVDKPNSSVSQTTNGVTIVDNRDGSYTVSTDTNGATADVTVCVSSAVISVSPHNKYLLCGCPAGGSTSTYFLGFGSGSVLYDTGSGLLFDRGTNPANGWYLGIFVKSGTTISSPITFTPQFFKLTEMFGSGNEPATVSVFKELFYKSYYPYNTGTTTCVSAVNGDPCHIIPVSWESAAGALYGGTLDLISGELISKFVKVTIDENSEITTAASGVPNIYRYRIKNSDYGPPASGNVVVKANYLNVIGDLSAWSLWMNALTYRIDIYVPDSITTVDEFKAYLKDHPLEVTYKTSETTTYQLTPQQLKAFKGYNNIFGYNVYKKDQYYPQVEYDLYSARDAGDLWHRTVSNQPHIASTSKSSLASFKTDLRAPVKECNIEFEPIQDLHGYDKPWPGGGGKNLINASPITITTEGDICSITLPAGDYVFSARLTNKDSTIGRIGLCTGPTITFLNPYTSASDGRRKLTLTLTQETLIRMRIDSCGEVDVDQIMVERGSTMSAYEPYENICPIEGCTGVTLYDDPAYGGTINFNQQAKCNTSVSYNQYGLTVSGTGDGSLTVSGAAEAGNIISITIGTASVIKDHVYYCSFGNLVSTGSGQIYHVDFWSSQLRFGKIRKASASANGSLTFRMDGNTSVLVPGIYYPQIFDLTQMFGETVAEYVYNLDTTTAGTGVQWFRNLFPADYYPYNTGTKTCVSAVNNGSYTSMPITFPVLGKNLWEFGDISVSRNKTLTLTKPLAAGQYTISGIVTSDDTDSSTVVISFRNSNNEVVLNRAMSRSSNNSRVSISPTLDSDVSIIVLYAADTDAHAAGDTATFTDIQIETGSSATFFEPYTNTLYGGTLDLNTGVLTVNRHTVIFDGSESTFTDYTSAIVCNNKMLQKGYSVAGDDIMTSHVNSNCNFSNSGRQTVQFSKAGLGITTIEELKAKLAAWKTAGTPFQYSYQLETPITYQLTAAQLKTFKGQNNIWSDTNGSVQVKYWTH